MIVWHCCSYAKLRKYLASGHIAPPVRAWVTVDAAAEMSVRRGSRLILRLRFPRNAAALPGHRGLARVVQHQVRVRDL